MNQRNELKILADEKDRIFVNDSWIELDSLYDKIYHFYTANRSGKEQDENAPSYSKITINLCEKKIEESKQLAKNDTVNTKFYKREQSKWELKWKACKVFPNKEYMEMRSSAAIYLENKGGTSYGLYLEIQNSIKKVVNDLRVEMCKSLNWPNYFGLDWNKEDDLEKNNILRLLVPERILEKTID